MKHGWEYKKLGEVITVKSGYTPNASELSNEGDIPYFKVAEMNLPRNEKYLYDAPQFVITPKSTFPKGSIVFPKNGAAIGTNKKRILVTPSVVDLNTAVAIPNSEIESNFLYYIFQKIDFRLITRRGTVPTLDLKELKNITIPVPSKDEQISICSLLDKINRVIEAKKEQLKELDNLAQAIFYDMFGDPVTNEKGWDVAKVIDVVKLQRGYDLPVQNRHSKGNIPIYGANGIVGYHTEAKMQYGIITGRSGSIGDVYMSKIPFWPLNTSLFSVDTHNNDIIFLMYLIKNYNLSRFKQGAGVPTLNRNSFHQNDIIDVPLHLQQVFAEKVEAIERQKELINQSLREVQTLFDSRMDYWFSEEDDDLGQLDKLD